MRRRAPRLRGIDHRWWIIDGRRWVIGWIIDGGRIVEGCTEAEEYGCFGRSRRCRKARSADNEQREIGARSKRTDHGDWVCFWCLMWTCQEGFGF